MPLIASLTVLSKEKIGHKQATIKKPGQISELMYLKNQGGVLVTWKVSRKKQFGIKNWMLFRAAKKVVRVALEESSSPIGVLLL